MKYERLGCSAMIGLYIAFAGLAGILSCSKQEDCGDVLLPPAEFDHPPIERIMTIEAAPEDVERECAKHEGESKRRACMYTENGLRIMLLPFLSRDITYDEQSRLIHHEWGHDRSHRKDHDGWATCRVRV